MTDITEVQGKVDAMLVSMGELNITLEAIDSKLDEIRAFITGLQAGVPVTQAQLDELAGKLDNMSALVDTGKSKAAADLAESDQLDEA